MRHSQTVGGLPPDIQDAIRSHQSFTVDVPSELMGKLPDSPSHRWTIPEDALINPWERSITNRPPRDLANRYEERSEEGFWPNYSMTPPGHAIPGQRSEDANWADIRKWWLDLPHYARPTYPGWWNDRQAGLLPDDLSQLPDAIERLNPTPPPVIPPEWIDAIAKHLAGRQMAPLPQ